MLPLSIDAYQPIIIEAIATFWQTRDQQRSTLKSGADNSNRGAVLGGKQLDGFLNLLKQVAVDLGVPESCIYLKANHLPGIFDPLKTGIF